MAIKLHDLVAALPAVGLAIGYLGQHRCGTWTVILAGDSPTDEWHAEGSTAAGAIINALRGAGVNIEDDGT